MEIIIHKISNKELFDLACSYTVNRQVKPSLASLYKSEHSPVRTQIFAVELKGIPLEVRDHLVRHKVGVEFYCRSHRDDRSGEAPGTVTYATETDVLMVANAQALINIARKRLCNKAHIKTHAIVAVIKMKMAEVDKELCDAMVPECYYRNHCPEKKSCGFFYETKVKPLIEFIKNEPNKVEELIKGAFYES